MITKSDKWNNTLNSIKFCAYVGFVNSVVQSILKYVFEIASPEAFAIAFMFTAFTAYPLFVSGTINPWSKDKKKWSFHIWATSMWIATILVYFVYRFLFS